MAGDVSISADGQLVDHRGVPLDLDLALPPSGAVDSVDGQTGTVDLSGSYDPLGAATAEGVTRAAADTALSDAITAHQADPTAAHAASAVAVTPFSTIAATTVQAALEELLAEAAAGVSDGDKGDIVVSSAGTAWNVQDGTITAAKVASDVATQAELDALPTASAADPLELDISTAGAVTTFTLLDTIARVAKDVNAQTANYTLAVTDKDGLVTMTNASARTVTFPQDSVADIPIGAIGWIGSGQGVVTMVQGTGATLNGQGTLGGTGDMTMWIKYAANSFFIWSPSGSVISHLLSYDHSIQPAVTRPKITSQYYFPVAGPKGTVTFSTLSRMLVQPVFLPAGTLDRIGIECTTTVATAVARLGVYSDLNGLPNNLIAEATGTADLNTATGYQTLTISAALPTSTRYWLAVVPQTALGTVRAVSGYDAMSWCPIGTSLPTAGGNTFGVLGDDGVTGALPNPIGGLSTGLAHAVPQFHIRYSA